MNWIDAVIIAVFLGSAFAGFKFGVMRAACICGAFILATVVGARGSVMFAEQLGELFKNPDLGYVISFMAVFSLVFVGLSFVGNAICGVVRHTPLGWIDSWIGSILGFLAGIVFAGLIIVYLTKYPTSDSEKWLEGSFITSIVRTIISPIFREFLKQRDMATSMIASMLWRS